VDERAEKASEDTGSNDLASQSIFAAFLDRDKDGKIRDFGSAASNKSIFSTNISSDSSSSAKPISIFANKGFDPSASAATFGNLFQKETADKEKGVSLESLQGNTLFHKGQPISNGEDNESVVFKARAKLYRRKAGVSKWAETGKGPLRLLKSKAAGVDSSKENEAVGTRLVMRRELSENGAGSKLLLNVPVNGLSVEIIDQRNVLLTCAQNHTSDNETSPQISDEMPVSQFLAIAKVQNTEEIAAKLSNHGLQTVQDMKEESAKLIKALQEHFAGDESAIDKHTKVFEKIWREAGLQTFLIKLAGQVNGRASADAVSKQTEEFVQHIVEAQAAVESCRK